MNISTGTIIQGTLRYEDLLPAFLGLLGEYSPVKADMLRNRSERIALIEDEGQRGDEESGLLEVIAEAIDRYQVRGYYFGALEGDGSDFGIWEDAS